MSERKPRSWSPVKKRLVAVSVFIIIALFCGLLWFAIQKGTGAARVSRAKTEMVILINAIKSYQSTYGEFPVSAQAAESLTDACPDFTFGTMSLGLDGKPHLLKDPKRKELFSITNTGNTGYQNCNAEVMGILMDLDKYRNGNPTANVNHAKNPQRINFLKDVRQAGDTVSAGIGLDGVYRDPWGNPYIITLDMNNDNRCRDAVYRVEIVSKRQDSNGYHGLHNNIDRGGFSSDFEVNAAVVVWSFGPDGRMDLNPAIRDPNQDNLLSWQ